MPKNPQKSPHQPPVTMELSGLRPYLQVFLLLIALAAPGCGRPSDFQSDKFGKGGEQDTILTLAGGASELPTVAGSYVVNFRTPVSSNLSTTGSFAIEAATGSRFVADLTQDNADITNVRFLSQIDMGAVLRPEGAPAAGTPAYLSRLTAVSTLAPAAMGILAQIDFTSAETAVTALTAWRDAGLLWFAEPNYVSHLSGGAAGADFKAYSNDYGKLNYWWLNAINLPQAMQAFAGRDQTVPGTPTDTDILTNRPIIAVLDSGVDYEHPALKARIWTNADVNAANCLNDVHGCNTTVARRDRLGNGEVWPIETTGPGQACSDSATNCSHGTHVAGLIAGDHQWQDPLSGQIPAGVCPICQLMILKIVGKISEKDSGILDSWIIAALKYVSLFRHHGGPSVRIINASFGKFSRSRAVGLMIRLLKTQSGILVIAAAGNEDSQVMEYPAAFADAIGVAAVDSSLRKVRFSNFGRWVSLAAPGNLLLSTVPGSRTDAKSGTSMAAPVVAGVAGLLAARYPTMDAEEMRTTLIATADPNLYRADVAGGINHNYYYPLVPQTKVRQPLLGLGLVDANAAISRQAKDGLPLYSAEPRVAVGCGTLGLPSASSHVVLLVAFGLAPLLTALWSLGRRSDHRRQLSLAILRKR